MKILIITQHIFPMQTPRSHRSTELALELSRQNHDVTVYAVLGKFNYSDFIKTSRIKIKNIPIQFELSPYSSDGIKKRNLIDRVLGKLLGKYFEFPNIEFKYRIKNIIKKERNFDLLISIANPHQIHWGCAKAKKDLGHIFPKVWIADCGDPYMNNNKTLKRPKRFEKDERFFNELCDFITVPFEGAKTAYYKEFNNKIKVIPQGFQFDLNRTINIPMNKVLSFAYTGTFLKDMRNPSKFLDYLCKVDYNFKFYVYTPFAELIHPFQKKLGEKLVIKNLIQREDLIQKLEKMDFLVNLENTNTNSQLPSKLIDYAISGRPILTINPKAPDKKIIDQFLNRNYDNQFKVKNLMNYHISNVANSFLKLSNQNDALKKII